MSKKKLAGIIAACKSNEGIAVQSSIAALKSSFRETSYEIYTLFQRWPGIAKQDENLSTY
jgi:hypothetical protein